jgi:hypothetical protein
MDKLDSLEWRRLDDDLTAAAPCGRTRATTALDAPARTCAPHALPLGAGAGCGFGARPRVGRCNCFRGLSFETSFCGSQLVPRDAIRMGCFVLRVGRAM